MKKTSIPFMFLLTLSVRAQTISGSITAKEDRHPIPYAKIGIENQNFGTIADSEGKYTIDLNQIDRGSMLKIEVGGYEKYVISVKEFVKSAHRHIVLTEKVKDIEEVKISQKKFIKENWGVNTKSKKYRFFHNNSQKAGGQELAVLFTNNKKVKLENININLSSFKTDRPVFIRFTIYDQELHPLLQEDLTDEISADKIFKKVYSYDVSNKQIWLTENFYIGVQLLNYFEGNFAISGDKIGNKTIFRNYYNNWIDVPTIHPAININVKVQEN